MKERDDVAMKPGMSELCRALTETDDALAAVLGEGE